MQACRIGDIGLGICSCHKSPQPVVGTIITGSPNMNINSMFAARFGDIVMCSCGHVSTIISGSINVTSNSIPQCKIGDIFSGCAIGSLIIGSPNVTI